MALAHLTLGDYAHVIRLVEENLEMIEQAAAFYLPETLFVRGRAEQGLGLPAARQTLQQAKEEAEKLGGAWLLWQILLQLAELSDDPTEAASLRGQARTIIEGIVATIDRAELRESFLQREDVRQLLDSPAV